MEILLIIAVVVIIYLVYKNNKTTTNASKPEAEPKKIKSKDTLDLSNKYKRKLLLTKTEYTFYGLLKKNVTKLLFLSVRKYDLKTLSM